MYHSYGFIPPERPGWTRMHAFLLIMGGFALFDSNRNYQRILDHEDIDKLYTEGRIDWPSISENEIKDRSKADIFSKSIVLIQTTWFTIQCISRLATKI